MATRYFTVEEANSLVPWLREVFEGIAPLRHQMAALEEEMVALLRQGRGNGPRTMERELAQKRRDLEAVSQELHRHEETVTAKGILVRDVEKGLVDFPSLQNGLEVFLCWLLGEAEVSYWHETDAGFAGRQPL